MKEVTRLNLGNCVVEIGSFRFVEFDFRSLGSWILDN